MNNSNRKRFHDSLITDDKKIFKELLSAEIKKDDNNPHYFGLIKFISGIYKNNGENDFLKSLQENKLWVASPKTFNDPYDCIMNIDFKDEVLEKTKAVVQELFGDSIANELLIKTTDVQNQAVNNLKPEFDKIVKNGTKEIQEGLFVSCFSELSNLYSILMWSHYANQHQGFCVEYDYRAINRLRIKDNTIIPVLYSDKPNICEIKNDSKAEALRYQLGIAFTKSIEWEYEKEWRLIEINDEDQKGKNGFLIPFVRPKRIYMGCRISDQLREDIIKCCYANNIDLYQMKLVSGTFWLEKEKVPILPQ